MNAQNQGQATTNHAQIAETAQILLSKANLTGAEVPAYVGVHNWSEAIKLGHLIVVEATELNALRLSNGELINQVHSLEAQLMDAKAEIVSLTALVPALDVAVPSAETITEPEPEVVDIDPSIPGIDRPMRPRR